MPDKVLKHILGEPVLLKMIERVSASTLKGDLLVATTTDGPDDEIAGICNKENIPVFRGHPTDLLDRHYQAAIQYNADAVVKIPSDCPLIDPQIIDQVLQYYISHSGKYDYVSNLHPASWPDGNDVEIMSMETLKNAWENATRDFEREHTTPYIWENPNLFRIGSVVWDTGLDYSTTHRWTLDYPEDFDFIKKVYEELYPTNNLFSLKDILNLLTHKPEIALLNNQHAGEYWYKNHLNDLKNIDDKWKNSNG